jgi:hypothetical protein
VAPLRRGVTSVRVVTLAALVVAACSTPGPPSRDARSRQLDAGEAADEPDAGGTRAPDAEAPDADAPDASLDAPDGGAAGRDGGVGDACGDDTAGGEVLARAPIGDAGAELRVEAYGDGYGFSLVAAPGSKVSVEPGVRIDGPVEATAYFGPRCVEVAPGRRRLLGLWTGNIARCVTSGRADAALDRRPARVGCPVARAPAGSYRVVVFPCGAYDAPLAAGEVVIRPADGPARAAAPPGDAAPAMATTGAGERPAAPRPRSRPALAPPRRPAPAEPARAPQPSSPPEPAPVPQHVGP